MAALQAGSSKRLMVGITHPNTILGWRSLGSRRERAEFMFPYFTVHGRGLGALSSPSFRIRESPRQHQAVGTRHRLMPALGERRARGKSGVGVQGDSSAQPSGDPPAGARGCWHPEPGTGHPQRAQCAAQGPPCSAGAGSPQDGQEEPDPALAGAAPQCQGGSQGSPAWSCWPAAGARVPARAYAPG